VDRLPHRHPRAAHRGRRRDDEHPLRARGARCAGGGRDRPARHRPRDRGHLLARLPAAGDRRAGRPRHRRHPRRGLRSAGRLLRLRVRARHRQQLRAERHVSERAGDRRRGAEPLPGLDGSQHVRALRRRSGSGDPVRLRRPGGPARLRDVLRWDRLGGDHRPGRRVGLPCLAADERGGWAFHPHGGARGLSLRDAPAGRVGGGCRAERRAHDRVDRPVRVPPGKPADHRERPEAARDPVREGVPEPREIRQYVRCVGADGARGSGRGRQDQRGRPQETAPELAEAR